MTHRVLVHLIAASVLAVPLSVPLSAADPEGFALWTNAQLKAFDKSQSLGDFKNHTAQMNHREKNGEVEVHANFTDVFVVQSGEASLMIGGTVLNGKSTAPGEIRGTTATGAEKHALHPGDIVHIPAGVPHQVILEPGKTITYFAVKIPKAT